MTISIILYTVCVATFVYWKKNQSKEDIQLWESQSVLSRIC
jgi:hypothetical protein